MLDEGIRLKRKLDNPTPGGGGAHGDEPVGQNTAPFDTPGNAFLPFTAWNISKLAMVTVIGGMIGLMVAIFWMRNTTPAFTATMVVGPTAQLGLAGRGMRVPNVNPTLSSNLSELHTDERVSDFEHFRRIMTSAAILASITRDEAFMRRLMPDRWDADSRRWQVPEADDDGRLTNWLRGTALPFTLAQPAAAPQGDSYVEVYGADGGYLAGWLKRQLLIRRVGETAMYSVSFRHVDREISLGLLKRLYERADRDLRREAKRRIDIQVAYLTTQMQRTDLASHRQAMSELLARELQTSLMLGVDLPFAADMIEPPEAARMADWPAPLPIAGVALLVGALLGFAIGFAWIDRQRRVEV
ncbi:MAG: hypothetical protein AAF213_01750 [Pseudomonadota bacterium]